jgi:hypothetical protein
MTKRKEFLLATITVIGTLLAMASIAEVVLRFFATASCRRTCLNIFK